MTSSNSSDTDSSNKPKFLRLSLLRIGIFVLVCLVTLFGLYHAEENVRGRNAWNKFRQELEAKGEPTSYAMLIPPQVPNDQNFAVIPTFAALFDYLPGTTQVKDPNAFAKARFGDFEYPSCEWTNAVETDFVEGLKRAVHARIKLKLSRENRTSSTTNVSEEELSITTNRLEAATQLLNEFTNYNGLFGELEKASQLPYSRFNVRYEQENKAAITLPHLAVIKHYCVVFSTRASARLAVGQTDLAFQDVNTALRIMDSVKNEPILISYLVRCAAFRICMQPVWEGLVRHQWSNSQVESLQTWFEKMHLLDNQALALRAERCFGDSCFDFWLAHPAEGTQNLDLFKTQGQSMGSGVPSDWILRVLIPRGWIAFERLNYHRLFMEDFAPCVNYAEGVIHPEVVGQKSQDLDSKVRGSLFHAAVNHYAGAQVLLPALFSVQIRTAQAQSAVNLATIACALERYRMANGQFPEELDALSPKFISKVPMDFINGKPLVYRCSNDGRFVLYSVGWDGKDDGGSMALNHDIKVAQPPMGWFRVSEMQQDWVWQFPK